jgi:hypothetical protein
VFKRNTIIARQISVFAFAATIASFAQALTVENFDQQKIGGAPKGWTCAVTGTGKPKWNIEKDTSAPSSSQILKQSGEGNFPWCVIDKAQLENGFVEVKFKAFSGQEDQAGGVVWRWKDANNYYIARANSLEDNVTVFYMNNGTRQTLKSIDLKVPSSQWHTLKVLFVKNKFTIFFNQKLVLELTDDSSRAEGSVGVWTKADSVTGFDDFKFGPELKN